MPGSLPATLHTWLPTSRATVGGRPHAETVALAEAGPGAGGGSFNVRGHKPPFAQFSKRRSPTRSTKPSAPRFGPPS